MKLKYSFYIVILTTFQGKVTHGAYKSKLLSIKDCKNPVPPKSNSAAMEGNFGNPERNLLNGSVIVTKNAILFLHFRAGVEENGKLKKYKLFYPKLTCKNILMKIILAAVNIKYNEDTCEVLKGNYYFYGLDINKLDHAAGFIPIREPGINDWYLSFYGNDGTYICFILRVELTLLKPKSR